MSRQIELDIFRFMSKHKSAPDCINQFLPFWRARGLTSSDINIICHFLFSNIEYKKIIEFSIENIERDEPVGWFFLTKALKIFEPELKSSPYEALKNYISENRKLDEFYVSELFDPLFPLEREFKLTQIQRKIQLKERFRQTLLDQIRVFNQSRNFSIEKQTIQKFLKFFPNDKQGKELWKRFETDELQRFFTRYKNEHTLKSKPEIPLFTPEEEQFLDRSFKEVTQAINDRRILIHSDLDGYVYFFLFLEDYARALQLVPLMEAKPARDWLQMELLLLTRRFADALSFLKELDSKYLADASYYPAKVYYVAQCFWGLGDQPKAIELMEDLAKIFPHYRMTSTFLKDWRTKE